MNEKSKTAAGAGNGRSNSTAPPHIVVCIKPVPDPACWEKLELDPDTMLLNRTDLPAVINPLDLNAIEQALILKETSGATISVLTMAPPEAEEQLREALAMGCDRACLASDRAFAGADTLATARCLAAAIRKIGEIGKTGNRGRIGKPAEAVKQGGLGAVDLVFCGSYSLDGSTAQVGPQIAEILRIPDLTGAVSLELSTGSVRVACKVEGGTLVAECDLPVLVTFDREAACPRLPTMSGIRRARELPIVTWSCADLALDPGAVGLAGSPTHMLNVFAQAQGRKGEILSGSPAEMAGVLVERLRTDKALD
jgi:electron transfer flavoprotein beta subunit